MKIATAVRTVTVLALGVTLAACGGTPATGSSSSTSGGESSSGAVRIVASTNVWGDIAATVGGDLVSVTSIVSDPSADPHSFEVSGQNQLAVSKAQLIVKNGGGYDDFMQNLLSASGANTPVIDAVTEAGHGADGTGELNEHVWYDLPTAARVATAIADSLSAIDPAHASTYQANATGFGTAVRALTAQEDHVAAAHAGESVLVTEPVPLYLTAACGLVDKTPPAFTEAIEGGTDVPANVLAQTLALITGKQVAVLVYNEQTTGPQTDAVLKAAKDSGVPVVPVTETLPAGKDYVTWMGDTISALEQALT